MSHSKLNYYVEGIVIIFTKGETINIDAYKLHLGLQHTISYESIMYIIKIIL